MRKDLELAEADNILRKFQTPKDFLVRSSDLEIISHPIIPGISFRLKCPERTLVYPTPEIRGVVDYLINKSKLWPLASINVLAIKWGMKRLPIYGVSFRRAVEIVLKEGFHKARFMISSPERFADRGLVAELLVHLGKNKEPRGTNLELEAWQYFGDGEEVFYIHGILSCDTDKFEHLDGAVICFEPEDKERLFHKGEKIKGKSKQKHFRLDGDIKMREAFEVVSNYLPISELSDEFFSLESTAV